MVTQYILTGQIKWIWLDEYYDEENDLHYSEGYYFFAEPATFNVEFTASNITEGAE
jgi:hypothetical protein